MIQKNSQKFKNILRKGVKWKVGNGRKILFWEDIWILDHPLCDDPRWNRCMEQCKNQIGTFVVDYWKDDMWVDLNSVDHNLVELGKCLNVFFLNHEEDDLIWKTNPSGMYSIASTYANSFDNHDEPCWPKAWVKGMTPKVNIFFWILLQNKFLTLDNLKKRGFIITFDKIKRFYKHPKT